MQTGFLWKLWWYFIGSVVGRISMPLLSSKTGVPVRNTNRICPFAALSSLLLISRGGKAKKLLKNKIIWKSARQQSETSCGENLDKIWLIHFSET